ncbi:hypothetical protein [Candidatus Poriferisodalis sp.]|uniref:hypothetical protein n=1 Tax=Candidatus Poriferisodalis sp. TaxID=3101277 RepID=UPI003B0228EA
MNSGDLAAVVVTVCVLIALVALIVVLTQAFALMRELRRKLEDFDAKVGPALGQLADTAEMAQAEISRLRDLLNIAQKVAGLAESAGAATARVAATPVDKVRSAISVLRGAQTGSTGLRDKAADEERETASGGAGGAASGQTEER